MKSGRVRTASCVAQIRNGNEVYKTWQGHNMNLRQGKKRVDTTKVETPAADIMEGTCNLGYMFALSVEMWLD